MKKPLTPVQRYRAKMLATHHLRVQLWVHRDDLGKVRQWARQLGEARKMGRPVP